MYGVGGDPPTRALLRFGKDYTVTDYPPVALYELGLAGIFYRAHLSGLSERLAVDGGGQGARA